MKKFSILFIILTSLFLSFPCFSQDISTLMRKAKAGDVSSQVSLGYSYYVGEGVRQDYSEAVKWWQKAAAKGNKIAQYNMALCYRKGTGVKQDLAESARLYRLAAEQGHTKAMYGLGQLYYYGDGVDQDYAEAAKWLWKGTKKRDPECADFLAYCLLNRFDVSKEAAKTMGWEETMDWSILGLYWREWAQKGYPNAQCFLGYYGLGLTGTGEVYSWAVDYLRQAADKGNARAKYLLGYCYEGGHGVKRDDEEAEKWYRLAAEQGNKKAKERLEMRLSAGQMTAEELYDRGVQSFDSQDYVQAMDWFRKAAEQGHAGAQNYLGSCYEKGLGVREDIDEAFKWYRLAAENGNATAKDKLSTSEYDYVIQKSGRVSSVSDETVKKLESQLDEIYRGLLKEYGDIIKPEHRLNPALVDRTERERIHKLSMTHRRLVQDKKIVSSKIDGLTIESLLSVILSYHAKYSPDNMITDSRTGKTSPITDYNTIDNLNKKTMLRFDYLMESPYFPKNDYLRQNALVKEKLEDECAQRTKAYNQYMASKAAGESRFEIDNDFSYAPSGELYGNRYMHDGVIYFKNVSRDECYVWYNRFFPKDEYDTYNRSYPYQITLSHGLNVKKVGFGSYEEMLMEIERAYKEKYGK